MSASQVIVGGKVLFTDASTNATSWKWTFQGGTPPSSVSKNQEVQYNTAGTYSTTLTINNSISITKPITVVEKQWTVSGTTYDGVTAISGVNVEYTPGGYTSSVTDGKYSFSVPNNWLGSIKASKQGLTFTDLNNLSITSDRTINLWGSKVPTYTISCDPINPASGTNAEYKLNTLGIGWYGEWNFGDSTGLQDDNGTGKRKHVYYCSQGEDKVFTVKCTVRKRYSTEAHPAVPIYISIAKCGTIIADAYYTNGCSIVKLGQPAYLTDNSEPFSSMYNLNIYWVATQYWDQEQFFTPLSPYYEGGKHYPDSRQFSHIYPEKGSYSVKWQACTQGYDNIVYRGIGVVDCNSTVYSNKLSDCTYSDYGGVYQYWAGNIIFGPSLVIPYIVNPDKKIIFSCCNEIIIKPGFWAKPNNDNYLSLKVEGFCESENQIKEIPSDFNSKPTINKKTETDIDSKLIIYPNPTSSTINLEYSGDISNILSIDVFNSTGALMLSKTNEFSNNQELNVVHYPPGVYCLRVVTGEKVFSKIFIKN